MIKTQAHDNIQKNKNLLLVVRGINICLLLTNFYLNFLGSPSLKYVYLTQVLFFLFSIFVFKFEEVFPEILMLFFIEGQGRVIWEYQSWSRIILDLITLLSITKIFISKKKIYDRKILPWPIILLITLHFCWYGLQIFNINALSVIGSIASSKIYIYPILLFLAFILSDLENDSLYLKKSLNIFLLIIPLEIALNYYQFSMKQSLLISISPYYFKAMRDGVFVNLLFRPFATTHLPGVLSVYLFVTVGFLYLKKFTYKGNILKIIYILGSIFSIIICQVRSALVKYIAIIIIIQIGKIIYDRFKLSGIIPIIIFLISFFIFGNSFFSNSESLDDQNMNYAKKRMSSLSDVNKMRGERIDVNKFSSIVSSKLVSNPFGLGAGMTGAAGSMNKDELESNPFINHDMLWTSDNLIISLVIDLGFGAIFYITLVLLIPIYFLRFLLIFYKKKINNEYNTLLVCFSTVLVVIIGNWGAVGLTYNPESFIFWFMAALGFKTIGKYKNAKTTNS